MTTTPQTPAQGNPRIYTLKPDLTFTLRTNSVRLPKPERAVTALVNAIALAPPKRAPLPVAPRALPSRQSLPTAVIDPARPLLKLGLDVHLEFIMAVVQQDHAHPNAPRKFTREELVKQVAQWVGEGQQVVCVQESCGFGFVLHRQLVAAGAQSFTCPDRSWCRTTHQSRTLESGDPGGQDAHARHWEEPGKETLKQSN